MRPFFGCIEFCNFIAVFLSYSGPSVQSSQSVALLHVVGQIGAHVLEVASQRSPSAQVLQSVWAEQVVGHVPAGGKGFKTFLNIHYCITEGVSGQMKKPQQAT